MRGDFFDEAMQYRDVDLAAQRCAEEEMMSESKHTPGPWRADCTTDEVWHDPVHGTPHRIARITAWPGEGRTEADTRLIAAAPDLLAACKAYLGAYATQAGIDWRKAEEMARAAIARAEGKDA